MAGLWPVSAGFVKCGNLSIHELKRSDVARQVTYVPQEALLTFAFSVREIVLMGRYPHRSRFQREMPEDFAAVEDALTRADIQHLADRPVTNLSGGERQRVLIARALVQQAKLLLLDEPFTGLDAPSADQLEHLLADLAAQGHAVLIATHDVEQARAWDLILCLNHRQVAFGTPEQALTKESLAATYGGSVVTIPSTGERVLLPAVREASDDTLLIADGYSCREQITQSTGRRALHLAEVLATACDRQRAA